MFIIPDRCLTAGSTSTFLFSVIMNLIALDYLHEDPTSTFGGGS